MPMGVECAWWATNLGRLSPIGAKFAWSCSHPDTPGGGHLARRDSYEHGVLIGRMVDSWRMAREPKHEVARRFGFVRSRPMARQLADAQYALRDRGENPDAQRHSGQGCGDHQHSYPARWFVRWGAEHAHDPDHIQREI